MGEALYFMECNLGLFLFVIHVSGSKTFKPPRIVGCNDPTDGDRLLSWLSFEVQRSRGESTLPLPKCNYILISAYENLGGGFKHFLLIPIWGKIPILTNIFQMG